VIGPELQVRERPTGRATPRKPIVKRAGTVQEFSLLSAARCPRVSPKMLGSLI
jgi:hypothetical protein